MTTALREEVSRVRLFAHTLVIRRKKGLGEEIALALSPFFCGFLCEAALCYDPVDLADPFDVFKKSKKKKKEGIESTRESADLTSAIEKVSSMS